MTDDPQGDTMTQITLAKGPHKPTDGEGCLLEWVSFLAGEPWSDHPQCVSPVIAAFGRRWNDDLSDEDRNRLLTPYVRKLLNTAGTKEQEEQRAWMVTDWMVRIYLPAWLDLAGLTDQATTVRALPALTSAAAWKQMEPTVQGVRKDAAAAWAAAGAAAGDAASDAARYAARYAAGDAASDAARYAAWDAARYAAWAAARDAAKYAAGAAAGAAAWDALQPTVTSLQASALQLLDDLIAVTA